MDRFGSSLLLVLAVDAVVTVVAVVVVVVVIVGMNEDEDEDEDGEDEDEMGRRMEAGEVNAIGCDCDCLEEDCIDSLDCRFDRCLAFDFWFDLEFDSVVVVVNDDDDDDNTDDIDDALPI